MVVSLSKILVSALLCASVVAQAAPVKYAEGRFAAPAFSLKKEPDYNLFYRVWSPTDAKAKAVLIIVHGLRSHSGRYDGFARRAAGDSNSPIEVWAYDQLSHGKSPRWNHDERNIPVEGKVKAVDTLSRQLGTFVKLVHKKRPDAPIFILSHSVGGLVSYDFAANANVPAIKGMVFLAPALAYFDQGAWNKAKIASVRTSVKLGLGNAEVPLAQQLPFLGLDFTTPYGFSHDPSYKKNLFADPQVRHKSPHFITGAEVADAIDREHAGLNGPLATSGEPRVITSVPVLFMHGTADILTSPEGSKDFFAGLSRIKGQQPELVRTDLKYARSWTTRDGSELDLVTNGYHELFAEVSAGTGAKRFVREDFEGHVLGWIRAINSK